MKSGRREWSSTADTSAMQALASHCWPLGLHPGGLGWSQATEQLAERIILIDGAGGDLDGWAGVTQPGSLTMQVARDRREVRADLIEWLIDIAEGPELSVDVFDEETTQDFIRVGFESAGPPFGYYQMGEPGLRAAVGGVSATAPTGYTIRGVGADETGERVAVSTVSHGDRPTCPFTQTATQPCDPGGVRPSETVSRDADFTAFAASYRGALLRVAYCWGRAGDVTHMSLVKLYLACRRMHSNPEVYACTMISGWLMPAPSTCRWVLVFKLVPK